MRYGRNPNERFDPAVFRHRIADCILADVKWAASATSAALARQSQASEATVTRLCHKLGFESYRKFQLALARDVMEQQEVEKSHAAAQPDRMRSILQKFLINKQEEVRATVQALDADQLRAALACLNAAHVVEVAAASHNLSIALEASVAWASGAWPVPSRKRPVPLRRL